MNDRPPPSFTTKTPRTPRKFFVFGFDGGVNQPQLMFFNQLEAEN